MNLDNFLFKMYEESSILNSEGRDSEAIYFSESVAVQALNSLGLTYCRNSENWNKSINCFKDALKIDPGSWLLWSNMCHAFNIQEKDEDALNASFQAIKFSGGILFDPYYNAGVTLTAVGRLEEAVNMYRAALQINPEHNQTIYNLALCLLRMGNYKEGWEKYEYRFKTGEFTQKFKDRFVQDHWDGRKYKKKSILVYNEQGIGDFIFYSRFFPQLKSLGGKLLVEVQDVLSPVLGENLKIDKIFTRPNTIDWPTPPDSDYCVSVSSLPFLLKIDSTDKIPNDPYIIAPNRPKPRNFSSKKFKIGICWAGNSDHKRDHTRSMFLNQFRPLANNPKVQLFGLLKGVNSYRKWPQGNFNLNEGIENFPMINLHDEIKDFSDAAHFINHLDLVVTVDTGLAHLAGAMGKPVWTLIGKEVDWRWGNDNSSIWYPSMRLFRRKDTWENLIQEVLEQLPV